MAADQKSTIELRSPELQEIMTKPPAWMARWGIMLILTLIVLSLLLSCFISYPEIVKVPVILDRKVNMPAPANERAIINLRVTGPCKIKPGQKVNIQFDQFPALEYGVVGGSVDIVKFIPENNSFRVEIILTQGLKTNSGKILPGIEGMQGIAEVKIQDISLFQRIMGPVFHLFYLH